MLLCGEFCSFLYGFELSNQLLGMESQIVLHVLPSPSHAHCPAPGRTLLGSEEEVVRLRGENVLVKSLIINLLKNGFFSSLFYCCGNITLLFTKISLW